MMSERKASDLFVECLEAEGVRYVFGIPCEETLDFNKSLSRSSISFVSVRHEQVGAYIADVYGRLTGHAGVCLGTPRRQRRRRIPDELPGAGDRGPSLVLHGPA
jgi:acetolactate synthase-1/2/3 large subunit